MHHIYISTYFVTNQAGFGAVIEENGNYLQVCGHLNNIGKHCEADLQAIKEILIQLPQISNNSVIYLDCPQSLFILRQGVKNNCDLSRTQCLRQIFYYQNEKKIKFELHQNMPIKKIAKKLAETGYHDYQFFRIVGYPII
jgi:hypothetical protein